jgi:hypothetical protein
MTRRCSRFVSRLVRPVVLAAIVWAGLAVFHRLRGGTSTAAAIVGEDGATRLAAARAYADDRCDAIRQGPGHPARACSHDDPESGEELTAFGDAKDEIIDADRRLVAHDVDGARRALIAAMAETRVMVRRHWLLGQMLAGSTFQRVLGVLAIHEELGSAEAEIGRAGPSLFDFRRLDGQFAETAWMLTRRELPEAATWSDTALADAVVTDEEVEAELALAVAADDLQGCQRAAARLVPVSHTLSTVCDRLVASDLAAQRLDAMANAR